MVTPHPTSTILVKTFAVELVVAYANGAETRALAGVFDGTIRLAVTHTAAKVARDLAARLLRSPVDLRRTGLAVRAFAVVSAGHTSESSHYSTEVEELHDGDTGPDSMDPFYMGFDLIIRYDRI